jgi:hypothetical protein
MSSPAPHLAPLSDRGLHLSRLRLDTVPGGHRLWLPLQTRVFHVFVPDVPSRVRVIRIHFIEFSSSRGIEVTVPISRSSYRTLRACLDAAGQTGAIAVEGQTKEVFEYILAPVKDLCHRFAAPI